jgi:hypothetical protein
VWYQLSLKHHPQNDNDACVNRLHHTIQQYRAEDLEVYGTIRKLFHIKQASGAPSLRRKNSFFILLETNVRHKTYISGIQYYSRTAILLHVCMGSLLTACSMSWVWQHRRIEGCEYAWSTVVPLSKNTGCLCSYFSMSFLVHIMPLLTCAPIHCTPFHILDYRQFCDFLSQTVSHYSLSILSRKVFLVG